MLDNCDSFHGRFREEAQRMNLVRQRCQKISYSVDIADKVPPLVFSVLKNRAAVAIKVSQLLPWSMDWDAECDFLSEDEIFLSEQLMKALNAVAAKGSFAAHVILAEAYADAIRNSGAGREGVYWWQQSQSGRVLSGVEKEWADNYVSYMERKRQVPAWKQKVAWHLEEALRLCGRSDADGAIDWDYMSSLADEFELQQSRSQFLKKAAEHGNIDAMRTWIDENDAADECWMFFYLAQMLGVDLTAERSFAITEDGSPYDDDVGGPSYVDEYPGVELPAMSEEQKKAAKQKAEALFQAIEQRKAVQERNAEIGFRKMEAELDDE